MYVYKFQILFKGVEICDKSEMSDEKRKWNPTDSFEEKQKVMKVKGNVISKMKNKADSWNMDKLAGDPAEFQGGISHVRLVLIKMH